MQSNEPIKTFIINLQRRTERKAHILAEFSGKEEFSLTVIEACEHPRGYIGLWNSIIKIIKGLSESSDEYVLICEDDHQFTDSYTKEGLFRSIQEARHRQADILCGGISWCRNALQLTDSLFWIDSNFSGTQFIVLFRKFLPILMTATLAESETPDLKFCSLTDNIFLIHPFISIQKEFGYSDATMPNNTPGHVENLFRTADTSIGHVRQIRQHYKILQQEMEKEPDDSIDDDVLISTYIIVHPERGQWKRRVLDQFKEKKEFEITVIEAPHHDPGEWMSIRRAIEMAMDNDDDAIIICMDRHEFTVHYSKELLFRNISLAHAKGSGYLLGGVDDFGAAIPVSSNLFWIDTCTGGQFTVIFRAAFDRILNTAVNEHSPMNNALFSLNSSRLLLYPFLSAPSSQESSNRLESLSRHQYVW